MTVASIASGGRRAAFEYWLTVYRRTWRGSLITSFVSPVLFLAAMGVGMGSLVHGGSGTLNGFRYAVYLAPGLLAATVMQTVQGEATWPVMGAIKWDHTYLGQLATPLTVSDVALGHLTFMTMRAAIVAVAFTVVTAMFGLVHSAGGAVLAIPAAILTGTAFAAPVAAFSASQERETGFILLYRFGVIPMFLFSGTFFPITQLPTVLQWVAYLTPLWHGVDLCRTLSLGTAALLPSLGHVLYLSAWFAVGAWLTGKAFTKRLVL